MAHLKICEILVSMLESGVNMLKYALLYWHSEYAQNYASIKGQGLAIIHRCTHKKVILLLDRKTFGIVWGELD